MKTAMGILLTFLLLAGCSQPQPQTDSVDSQHPHYEGLPIRVGLQGDEGLPVELAMQEDESLPVEVYAKDDTVLQVEVMAKPDKALPVSFGLPEIPRPMVIPLACVGGSVILACIFMGLGTIACCRAAKHTRRIAEMVETYLQKTKE